MRRLPERETTVDEKAAREMVPGKAERETERPDSLSVGCSLAPLQTVLLWSPCGALVCCRCPSPTVGKRSPHPRSDGSECVFPLGE